MERETRLVSCSLAIDVSPLFALSGKSHKQTGSALGSLAQLAKMQLLALSSANKKKSYSGLLFISGRRGCLDLFALNVPTCFDCVILSLVKSTSHSAHRSLELGQVFDLWRVLTSFAHTKIKKP